VKRRHDRSYAHAETDIRGAVAAFGGDREALAGAVASVLARDLSGLQGTPFLTAVSALSDAAARAAAYSGRRARFVAEGFMIGVVSAAGRDPLPAVIAHAAGTFLKHACAANGDAGAATLGLVEGAARRAGELGLDAEEAALAARRGAEEAADDVGPWTGWAVRGRLAAARLPSAYLAARR
jgi:hypothetical protein